MLSPSAVPAKPANRTFRSLRLPATSSIICCNQKRSSIFSACLKSVGCGTARNKNLVFRAGETASGPNKPTGVRGRIGRYAHPADHAHPRRIWHALIPVITGNVNFFLYHHCMAQTDLSTSSSTCYPSAMEDSSRLLSSLSDLK